VDFFQLQLPQELGQMARDSLPHLTSLLRRVLFSLEPFVFFSYPPHPSPKQEIEVLGVEGMKKRVNEKEGRQKAKQSRSLSDPKRGRFPGPSRTLKKRYHELKSGKAGRKEDKEKTTPSEKTADPISDLSEGKADSRPIGLSFPLFL